MKRSTDRIQTTHVGSLPRPDSLVGFMIAEDKGEAFDEAAAQCSSIFDGILPEPGEGNDPS